VAVAVIEINDSGIGVSRGEGLLLESPGCAVLGERKVLVGEEALRHARLYPRRANDLFWSRLDQTPLDNPVPQARSFADVAYLHLREVVQSAGLDAGDQVVFAVPGTFEREQLALLLGIAQACSLEVLGIVDSAVAAAAAAAPLPERVLHLDLQLHQAAITSLRAGGAALLREEVVQVGGSGLARALDALVRLAGDLFVRETRFDPLHSAEAEQSLTDNLRLQLAELAQSPGIPVSVSAGRRLHRVTLPRELVIERLRPELSALVQRARELAGGAALLLLSHRLARLPGALSAFELGAASRPLPADAAAVGALTALPQLAASGPEAQGLPFVTSLAVEAQN